ncbi:hypothetical protein RRG08_032252 [Elysia crispata]|uniref:Uncharacterized protein n=1 Tax=Elysia crispata TaxID=231223 RepID=A0AAE1E811_9GAST|nr:hypothetical protein RRG08_032252 [Elysia crispata]
MARNEEKQLARLNRFYLQQQKEEELRKRPPRPRLEVLSTLDDVKKWIPSILKDIEFYVKQMEVSCYPKKTIEQFEQRINHLRGEYKAFVRKAHELEPDLSATPWSDRPYSSKRQKLSKNEGNSGADAEPLTTTDAASCKIGSKVTSFVPLSTPLLLQVKSCPEFYGCRKSGHHASPEMSVVNQDQPLDFDFTGTKELGHTELLGSASSCTDDACNDMRLNGQKASEGDTYSDLMNKENGVSIQRNSICSDEVSSLKSTSSGSCSVNQSLNLPYSDSSSDEET